LPLTVSLSFARTSAAGQVIDLSALILTQSRLDGHSPAPPAPSAPVPLRRPPPARDREPCPASATRRAQPLAESFRRILTRYFEYYHRARTPLSLDKDAPDARAVEFSDAGRIVEIPEVGGLHHRYVRRAA